MNFETEKILKNVLEFYQSSGLLTAKERSIPMDCTACFAADGNQTHFEQLLFFIFGHLLPEFIPQKITCTLSGTTGESHTMDIHLDFSGVTKTAMQEVLDTLKTDARLERLLGTSGAGLDLAFSKDDTAKSIVIHFPVQKISMAPEDIVLNFKDLAKRYDGMELALTLLEGYVMNGSRHISLLRTAMEHRDWKEAHRHAHALKGGALNVCAEIMARKAKIIETLIKEERYTDVPEQVDQLERACGDLETTWERYQEDLHG